jgi:ribosomal protein S12 methylthiotransferase
MSTSVHFVSLGCPKNLVDSQVMLGRLAEGQYSLTQEPQDAEVIIVNTCSFIASAKEESIDTILEMAAHKESGSCKALVVSGCLPQRYSKEIESEIPEIDLMIGTGQYHRITELLGKLETSQKLGAPLPKRSYIDQPAFIHTENDARVLTGPRWSAYLKISEGCNRRCSFCIIPKLRGNVRSRSVASLVQEAQGLVRQGARELNLVAQDLTEYGMEWKYRENLEQLLPQLAAVSGLDWIRLHYVYPERFSAELLQWIATEPKAVKYLDMPIQHTQDAVLERMNRRLRREQLFDLIARLRDAIPGIAFRTSIIVGFPGETEEQFQALCQDLESLDLDHVGVFRYSKEEGTPAAELDHQVPATIGRRRQRELTQRLSVQRTRKMEGRRGQTMRALVESVADGRVRGRLEIQASEIDGGVWIDPNGQDLAPGMLVPVVLTGTEQADLTARVVSN